METSVELTSNERITGSVIYKNTVPDEYKSDIKWIENVEPLPLTPFEINNNRQYLNPEKLLQLEQEEKLKEHIETEEEKELRSRKEYITKVKIIALERLNKHPLANPSYFNTRDKNKTIAKMKEVMEMTEEEITTEFNNICCDSLFSPEADYSNYKA